MHCLLTTPLLQLDLSQYSHTSIPSSKSCSQFTHGLCFPTTNQSKQISPPPPLPQQTTTDNYYICRMYKWRFIRLVPVSFIYLHVFILLIYPPFLPKFFLLFLLFERFSSNLHFHIHRILPICLSFLFHPVWLNFFATCMCTCIYSLLFGYSFTFLLCFTSPIYHRI